MILNYCNYPLDGKQKRIRVKAKVTTDHCSSHYGQPVVVLPDGGCLDLISWVSLDYRVIQASKKEYHELRLLGLV